MAKNKRNNPSIPAAPVSQVTFRMCGLYFESLTTHPGAADKVTEFMEAKSANPTAPVWKDTPFVAAGPIGSLGLNIKHAHNTKDLSICYRIHGRPPMIDIYGVFSHKELGTTDDSKIRTQQQMAIKFGNQTNKFA